MISEATSSVAAAASTTSTVTFSICPQNEADDEYESMEEEFEACNANSLAVVNPFSHLRRFSDQGIRNAKDQIRRFSNSSSKLIARFLTEHNQQRGRNGGPRKCSADPMSILKAQKEMNHFHHNNKLGLSRKSVSFCQRDNIHVYENEDEISDDIDLTMAPDRCDSSGIEGDRSLVPSFVFPGKKPSYRCIFEKCTMILESVDIDEDLCLMGNIRVNFARLQQVAASKRRVSIVAKYSLDDWATTKEAKAMLVRAQAHPALSHLTTKAMRFCIECDDLQVGDVLKFLIVCYGYRDKEQLSLSKDDNDGLQYQVNCTPKLNIWAAKAAQELKNYAPVIKYNSPQQQSAKK